MPRTAEHSKAVALLRGMIRSAKRSRRRGRVRSGFVLESGSGRLSAALQRRGVPSIAVDIKQNIILDLTEPCIVNFIKRLVACRAVTFV